MTPHSFGFTIIQVFNGEIVIELQQARGPRLNPSGLYYCLIFTFLLSSIKRSLNV